MRCDPSCGPSGSIPLIDRAPINPLDPIAHRAAGARNGGQGRRLVFRGAGASTNDARPEHSGRRRSLALDRSEHDGRLMAVRDGGASAAVSPIIAMLTACVIFAFMTSDVAAQQPDNPPSDRSPAAGTSFAPWAVYIAEAARRFAIPERWIRAVMAGESVGDPAALSPKGAIGLMQIMPATWDELRARHGLGDDPWQPRDNILAGAAYLRELHDRYGAIDAMLAAYNVGPTRYDEHLAGGHALPDETIEYVAKIAPMIDGSIAVASAVEHPARPSWSRAALFVVRSTAYRDDQSEVVDPPSFRPSNGLSIVDLSALVPPSDGLFVQRPEAEREQR